MKSSRTSSWTSLALASGRSTLLMTTMGGGPSSRAFRVTKRVWGMGPSAASTRISTPSTIRRIRSTSPPKSACPGVSTMLIFTSPQWTAVFLERMVMPLSRSRGLESMTRVGHFLVGPKDPGLPEHLIHQRRFSMVHVGDDRHVSYLHRLCLGRPPRLPGPEWLSSKIAFKVNAFFVNVLGLLRRPTAFPNCCILAPKPPLGPRLGMCQGRGVSMDQPTDPSHLFDPAFPGSRRGHVHPQGTPAGERTTRSALAPKAVVPIFSWRRMRRRLLVTPPLGSGGAGRPRAHSSGAASDPIRSSGPSSCFSIRRWGS